jgi:hypothetical protein
MWVKTLIVLIIPIGLYPISSNCIISYKSIQHLSNAELHLTKLQQVEYQYYGN